MDDEREGDRGWVKSVVEEALGHVDHGHPAGEALVVEHELVFRRRGIRDVKMSLETLAQIAGVEHRLGGRFRKSRVPERRDVSVGAHEDAEIAVEGPDPADGFLRGYEGESAVVFTRDGGGQVRGERFRHGQGAGARSASAVGRGERLVEIQVHQVEPHGREQRLAQEGIGIGAVAVHQAARPVHQGARGRHVLFKDAERIGIGEHEAGDAGRKIPFQFLQVQAAVRAAFERRDPVAAHGRRGGIRAVARIGRQHDVPLLAPLPKILSGDHEPRQLAVGSGRRRHAHRREPGDDGKRALQFVHELQVALHGRRGQKRVTVPEGGEPGEDLVQPRVVLHRAAAQRVEGVVDAQIAARQGGVVADRLAFADLGQVER